MACLQNAWLFPRTIAKIKANPKVYRYERIWKYAFYHSRSGQRLRRGLGDELFDRIIWENASPEIGTQSSSYFPADAMHIHKWLGKHDPDIVIACGKSAEESLRPLWRGRLICMPHPAHRLITDKLIQYVAQVVKEQENNPFQFQMALRQLQGRFNIVDLSIEPSPCIV